MQPRILIRPYEKSRTHAIPDRVTTSPQLRLPARASTSHESHASPPARPLGRGIRRALVFARPRREARLAKCKCSAITRVKRSDRWLSRKDQKGQSARWWRPAT